MAKIRQPQNRTIKAQGGSASLKFNPNFASKWNKRYDAAQKFVDSEVLRGCEPLTPMRTGMLIKSGTTGTDIGSGLVQWTAPYARKQYYSARKVGSETGKDRGPYWFARYKALHGRKLVMRAKQIAGGGAGGAEVRPLDRNFAGEIRSIMREGFQAAREFRKYFIGKLMGKAYPNESWKDQP